jgi:patatin-like phospholipase/acyl hydrolase
MTFPMISFTGGGLLGYWGALVMSRLDAKRPGWRSTTKFFSGTSTGAILAAGLALGLEPVQLADLYVQKGPAIFSRSWWRRITSPFGGRIAKYGNEGLIQVIKECLAASSVGDVTFRQLRDKAGVHLMTPFIQIDYPIEGVYGCFPCNVPVADTKWDDVSVALAAAASCCEPYYFPTMRLPGVGEVTGGGLLANDPSDAALSKVLNHFPEAEPVMLAFGTGERQVVVPGGNMGLFDWAPHLVTTVLKVSVEATRYRMQERLGERYMLVTPRFNKNHAMDDVGILPEIRRSAEDCDLKPVLDFLDRQWSA